MRFDNIRFKKSKSDTFKVHGFNGTHRVASGTTPPQQGTLAHATMIAMVCEGDISSQRSCHIWQNTTVTNYDGYKKMIKLIKPTLRHHDPYIVSLLLTLAQDGQTLWPREKRARGDRPVSSSGLIRVFWS
jgi:hypothetical protein